jgi:hypothetical protein
MSLAEIRAMMELALGAMREWKRRDYATERAIIEVLESDFKDTAAIMRAKDMVNTALMEDLHKAEPEGNG